MAFFLIPFTSQNICLLSSRQRVTRLYTRKPRSQIFFSLRILKELPHHPQVFSTEESEASLISLFCSWAWIPVTFFVSYMETLRKKRCWSWTFYPLLTHGALLICRSISWWCSKVGLFSFNYICAFPFSPLSALWSTSPQSVQKFLRCCWDNEASYEGEVPGFCYPRYLKCKPPKFSM